MMRLRLSPFAYNVMYKRYTLISASVLFSVYQPVLKYRTALGEHSRTIGQLERSLSTSLHGVLFDN